MSRVWKFYRRKILRYAMYAIFWFRYAILYETVVLANLAEIHLIYFRASTSIYRERIMHAHFDTWWRTQFVPATDSRRCNRAVGLRKLVGIYVSIQIASVYLVVYDCTQSAHDYRRSLNCRFTYHRSYISTVGVSSISPRNSAKIRIDRSRLSAHSLFLLNSC